MTDFTACAGIVERGDPDRFLAAMASPVDARRVLFPLYAFNVEVSRAPWVTEEPMIAEMRLQWWRDALEEIAEGRPVRSHEVTTPLAQVLDADAARALDGLVAARRWDIYKEAFEDEAHFDDYMRQTGGQLMWQACRLLGAPEAERDALLEVGRGVAVSRLLAAAAALEARGRIPLLDGTRDGIVAVARSAAAAVATAPSVRRRLPKLARAAVTEGWAAAPILAQIIKAPGRVAEGAVGISPFRSKLRLLRWS